MKTSKITSVLFLCIYGCTACHHHSVVSAKTAATRDSAVTIKGDFDGDGVQEYAWLVAPKFTKDGMDCIGKCVSIIQFSNRHIQPIRVNGCIGGVPTNLGNLNNNGGDEIGLLPEWFAGCWRSYLVYTYKHSKWSHAVPPFPVHCNTVEEDLPLIERDSTSKGMVRIRYSVFEDPEIVTKTKSIPIN